MKSRNVLIIFGMLLVIVSLVAFMSYNEGKNEMAKTIFLNSLSTGTQSTIGEDRQADTLTALDGTCVGDVSATTVNFNDINEFNRGTDPAGNFWLIGKEVAVADDGSDSYNLKSTETFLGAWDSTTYFSQEGEFYTDCKAEIDVKPELALAGAPTVTLVNNDGITKNADASAEDVGAGEEIDFEVTVKSPTDSYASKYGALVVVEYDKTFVEKVDATLGNGNTPDYLEHTTNQSGSGNDFDGFKTFVYDGELSDGAKDTFTITVTQTDETPVEDSNNVRIYWLPINKDIDQDDFSIITGVEDEDNNAITLGNTSAYYYTE